MATSQKQKDQEPVDDLLASVMKIDYEPQITGKDFRDYAEIVGDQNAAFIDHETGTVNNTPGKMLKNQKYFFDLYRVEPLFKERFPGVKGTPKDFIGLRIKDKTPVFTSKITVADAILQNAQIVTDHGRTNGKYYLISKTKN